MKIKHPFIFEEGFWLGEGKATISERKKKLPFYTSWEVRKADKSGKIICIQKIQITELSEMMCNHFAFYHVTQKSFHIQLNNQSIGKVIGNGLLSPKMIGWEFRLKKFRFEGFEFYEKTSDPEIYLLHAEYVTSQDFRTVLHGKMWKKEEKIKESRCCESGP